MKEFQKEVEARGQTIFDQMEADGQSIFNRDWWYGRIMDWSMKNAEFKTQMFRFVDVLPYLKSGSEVARHLKEYFAEGGENLPSVFNFGVGIGSLAPGLLAGAVRKNVTQMAKMFITGETPKEALPVLKKARKNQIAFTVDLLGEACLSEKEAEDYLNRYLELINWLTEDAKSWDDIPLIDSDYLGEIPKVNVSVKLSALYSQMKPLAWNYSKVKVKERLRPILDLAMSRNAFINIDMEKYEIKDLTFEIFKELLNEPAYRNYRHFGIVVQAYLRDSFKDIQDLVEFSRRRGTPFSIRLVKGAYWDYETIMAEQRDWPYPVYTIKKESDANYERCMDYLLDHYQLISLAIGSHNVRSIAAGLVKAEKKGVPRNAIEVQMLYGMADPFKKSLVKQGYRIREYATVGELIPGMAYLVRRLLENTSNESFLRSKFADQVDNSKLLQDPTEELRPSPDRPQKPQALFTNEPLIDFSKTSNHRLIESALQTFRQKRMGQKVYPIIDHQQQTQCQRTLPSLNPSSYQETVAEIHLAGIEEAEKALQSAHTAFQQWRKTPVEERCRILEKTAEVFRMRRAEIIACQILEAGKGWHEADGDVAEAIDFLTYYAKDMRNLAKPQRVGSVPGELSQLEYQPLGVSVVISPWNFPLAILTGMVAGSLVTGNTVVFKPAEQTSLTGLFLMEALMEAGLPKGVAHFLPGLGEEVGAHLADHPKTALICFTGSKEVGLKLVQAAAKVHPGQHHVKKCIAEMGGKNAVIIDSDADLDEAVAGVIYSAFGFQGQKCSAASRVIVLEEIYDRFVERLAESTRSLKVGPAEDPSNTVGPVIDEQAYKKIRSMIQVGESEARKLETVDVPQGGYFVPPTIFVDVSPKARIAQEEIFGPVTAVIKAKDLGEAIEIANGVEYALTGGIFSRSPSHIEIARERLEAGNVYINRGITGAMVDRHPFGGYKLSGIGCKTGGPNYLKQFMHERVVIENTVRRGFAPVEQKPEQGE